LNMPDMRIPVMPDIAGKIRSLVFEMTDKEDVTTGIHPFTFSYQDQAEVAAVYEVAERYQIIQQGLGAPTLSKAAELARPMHTKLPRTLMEATISYGNFRVALHVLLGPEHPITRVYDIFWSTWNASQAHLLNIWMRTPGGCFQHSQCAGSSSISPSGLGSKPRPMQLWEHQTLSSYSNRSGSKPCGSPTFRIVTWELCHRLMSCHARPAAVTPVGAPFPVPALGVPPAATGTQGTLERKSSPLNQAFQPFVDLNLRVQDVLQ
jgi:hypothetical protein